MLETRFCFIFSADAAAAATQLTMPFKLSPTHHHNHQFRVMSVGANNRFKYAEINTLREFYVLIIWQ
jgi:hypothetical protein